MDSVYNCTPLSNGERMLKIGEVLTKLSPPVGWSTFLGHNVYRVTELACGEPIYIPPTHC